MRDWQDTVAPTGLVRTPSDFGLRAEPPSHPELLDWLALKFMAKGWSVKAMHRLIAERAGHHAIAAAMTFADHSEVALERLEAERAAERRRAQQ